jgi:molybdenum cofactor cytidylyltransferase
MKPGVSRSTIAAVVLAAGESRRMGSPKLVLPWGGHTVIGQVVRTLTESGLNEIIVVTGGASRLVEAALESFSVHITANPDYSSGEMLTSIQVGLQALSSLVEAALVVLGDQPQIEAGVVKSVIRMYDKDRPVLLVPSYQMHRGHPWLVARILWPSILSLRPPATLRDFLVQHVDQITYLPVDSASILQDLDTPEDYDRYTRSR